MGLEFLIHTDPVPPDEADRIFARALGGRGIRGDHGWEYRSPENTGVMPDVFARRDDAGFYLSMFGGTRGLGPELLGILVIAAMGAGSSVRVEEL